MFSVGVSGLGSGGRLSLSLGKLGAGVTESDASDGGITSITAEAGCCELDGGSLTGVSESMGFM